MFRVELAKAARRWRTWLLAAGGAAMPILIVVSLLLSDPPGPGEGPPFLSLVVHNGLFASFTSLVLVVPFFLPLATGLLAGDSIAGEASNGTLRYLMVRPVGRTRFVLAKFGSVMALVVAGVLVLIAFGVAAGGLAYGLGPVPTLSGSTLSFAGGLVRLLAAGGYVALSMAGLAAIGVFISTLTDSGPGAAAATVIVAIVSQIVDALPSLSAVHPYLLTHQWLAFGDVVRSPVAWGSIESGVLIGLSYTAVFLLAALARFSRRDVTT